MSTQRPTLRHELNNLLCKIIGTAELAQDIASQDDLRAELEVIIRLAEEGASLLAAADAGEPGPESARCND